MKAPAALLALVVAILAWPASASAVSIMPARSNGYDISRSFPQPTPVDPQVFLVNDYRVRPPGFRINGFQAVAIAARQPRIQRLLAQYPRMKARPTISPLALDAGIFYHWSVQFLIPGDNHDPGANGEVEIGGDGHVYEVNTGVDVGWPLEHGYSGVLGRGLNAPYVWLPLCFFFLLPFIDVRRPFRLLHLDLLMLLGFGASHYFFNLGKPWISVPLIYPFLLYCVVRMAVAGFRPRRRSGPLIPHIGNGLLIAMLVMLLAGRAVFAFAGSEPFDVGYAGVIGADRIEHGQELYVLNQYHPDTYGPVNYLAYIPFELAFPYHGETRDSKAAEAATAGFDLLMVVALLLLGPRIRPGPPGRRLGLGLAYGWAAYPYTSLLLASSTNDALVPLFVIAALVAVASPVGRGAWLALGTMVKFVPGLLLPPLAAGRSRITLRSALVVGVAFGVTCLAVLLPVLPDGGFREFWDTTLGFQLHRTSPLTIWGRHQDLGVIKTAVAVAVVAFAVVAAWWPARRTVGQVAALCGAVIAAAQMGTGYWLYFYLVWFAPLLLIASFAEHSDLGPEKAQASRTISFGKLVRRSHPSSVTATRSSIRTPNLPGR